ncbi:hypothetical protein DRQ32_05360, partial [bacterium]
LTAPALAWGSPRAHDGGFMLRMTGGFGGGSTSISNSTNELKFEGGQGEFTLAIGGVVRENLALHGTLFSFVMVDPDIRIDGGPAIPGSGNVSMNGVGAGLTWWAMPANFYVSGSAGIGRLTADPDNAGSSSSDRGFAMELALGKEWFMSDRWGLGLGGGLSWHTIPDGLIDENWSGTSISVRFSATFN